MLHDLLDAAGRVLGVGLDSAELGAGQMAARAVLVFLAALAFVRLGNKRFLGRNTAFDLVLGLMFGSVLSRAITGNAPLVPALAAGATLVAMHWVLGALAFHSHRLGVVFKGNPRELVRDGSIAWREMRRTHVTTHDLEETLRSNGHVPDVAQVGRATLERSGEISVVTGRGPRVIEVAVAEGVQTVRLDLG